MEKVISIRPSKTIIHLFNEIKIADTHQEADRSSIFNRALEMAADKNIDWKAISLIRFKVNTAEIVPPEFMKIKVDETGYNAVLKEIKDTFLLKRVTAPYLAKLVLSFYLSELKKGSNQEVISLASRMVDFGLDCLVFKKEYDLSNYAKKEKLYQLSKKYLEEYDVNLNKQIRNQVNVKIKNYSDYFNIDKYVHKPRGDFGTCNIIFVAKVLSGLFLTLSEIEGYDLNDIIESLKGLMVAHDGERKLKFKPLSS
ncbi:hypothetical protein J9303_09540 [Bacillaceae bacterium Marseille-Q3522]|nr:hypothetical protein [Bacillaceae bacterium Marseille-Q3522]